MDSTSPLTRADLGDEWRSWVADLGGLEAFARWWCEQETAPERYAEVLALATELYPLPDCSDCEDTGITEEVYGGESWPVVCTCAAGKGLDDERIVFVERGASRARGWALAAAWR